MKLMTRISTKSTPSPTDDSYKCFKVWRDSELAAPRVRNSKGKISLTHDIVLVQRKLGSVVTEIIARPNGDYISTNMLNERPLNARDAERVRQLAKYCGGCTDTDCALWELVNQLNCAKDTSHISQ